MDEKDQIIAELREQVQMLLKRIEQLEEEIARLRKDSHNSSKPPSSDIVKPPKVLRRGKNAAAAAKDYFRFLTEPGLEPTNNRAERQIRPVVIDRRITQGTRGQRGMRWCERIWTTLATCKKQNRNVLDFIHESLIAHWSNKEYPSLIC
jgi:hypothetical protein